jgi:6-phosphofructokinase 1
MNACIRSVVRYGIHHELQVYGIRHGYAGLVDGDLYRMTAREVGNIIQRGGTILGGARCPRFKEPEVRQQAAEHLTAFGIGGLVVVGGDGSFRGARALQEFWPGPVVGIPATIDNDIQGTETTIGYDTAINTAVDAIDRIRDTAEAQERVFLVEVMGRGSGAIALDTAIAGGAVAALVPEEARDVDKLLEFLQGVQASGRKSSIIVVAEGEEHGGAFEVARLLEPHVTAPIRVTVLGHIQRGGSPTATSRILGTRLGVAAVDALLAGEREVMIAVQGGQCVRVPLQEAVGNKPAEAGLSDLILALAG